ncbi:mechanosensitive ion channel family protein [Flavobacterium ponti]|uniref:Mechanosensitive ion channel family protein n=1 Tax=Flavobacterium ponti TaxID=665133 RepID=A0ABV9P8I8_9FLAO
MIKMLTSDSELLIHILFVIVITIIIASVFNGVANRYIKKSSRSKHLDPTSFLFAKKFIIALIYIIGISLAMIKIPAMKTIGHSLLAGAGILSLVAGLASQQALSNIMSGFLIVLFKPFRINDRITFNGTYTGTVEEINLRQVVLRDNENNRIIVPNSVISSQVIVNSNLTDSNVCKIIQVGIGYNSDIGKALKIMEEEIKNHPLHLDNRSEQDKLSNVPEVISRVVSLDNSSVSLKAWAYANSTSNGFILYCDVLRSIKERFDKEGIEIPYNYQNIIIKKDN